MKIENLFIRMAATICFVLLSSMLGIAIYDLTVEWGNISALFLGLYLYSAYILFAIICDKPRNRMHHINAKSSHAKKPSVSRNKVYKY